MIKEFIENYKDINKYKKISIFNSLIEDNIKQNNITEDIINFVIYLSDNNDYLSVEYLTDIMNPYKIPAEGNTNYRKQIFYHAAFANFNLGKLKKCMYWFSQN